MAATMGDEAQKRNTDCVYFLASPLTCKKGMDCEYRHSEAARVNPRDCWYWLSGNCLNASCSFRHPPLDGRPAATTVVSSQVTSSSSAAIPTTAGPLNVQSTPSTVSTPPTASKSTVPCFFFSQGYCAKGGKCPFLHGSSTQYRKEATTYQRPQANEQPVNGEGNGVLYAKQQLQDRKPASQMKAPVRAAHPIQEAGYIPSNVYKLSVSGAPVPPGKRPPGLAEEKIDQSSQIGRSQSVQNAGDATTRKSQLVESRTSQAHVSDECGEQGPSNENDALRAQLLQRESGRSIRPSRQANPANIARVHKMHSDSEVQDTFYEVEGQQNSARDIHAGDLRNLLKRKKNDPAYWSQVKEFHGKEFSRERPEISRLASRAVTATEVPSNSKRAKQDKESSTFPGPKTLAQIKAEKARVSVEDSLKAADCIDDLGSLQSDIGERKRVVDIASELHGEVFQDSLTEPTIDCSGMSAAETKSESKEVVCSVASELGETGQKSRPGIGTDSINGLSFDSSFRSSKEAHSTTHHCSQVDVKQSLKNEEDIEGNKPAYDLVNAQEGGRAVMDVVSPDDIMEDNSEALENTADTECPSDYEDDDDFARKLGSYLS